MKQLHNKIPKVKTNCYHHSQPFKEINVKNKQLKTEQLLHRTLSPEKNQIKAVKIAVPCLAVEKFNKSLEYLLP